MVALGIDGEAVGGQALMVVVGGFGRGGGLGLGLDHSEKGTQIAGMFLLSHMSIKINISFMIPYAIPK